MFISDDSEDERPKTKKTTGKPDDSARSGSRKIKNENADSDNPKIKPDRPIVVNGKHRCLQAGLSRISSGNGPDNCSKGKSYKTMIHAQAPTKALA